ncbi:MAG: cadherin-like domain-containing protein, partial [Gammaproteobacteria bacterium]|nr:cadherin-like domain-containing protein [Gammaproteobacteria bacterium]
TLSPGGTLFGTPSIGQEGVYQVTIGANDGTATVTTTFSLTVSAVPNQAPVADDESVSVVPGGVATQANLLTGLTLLDGDTDPDGNNLTAVGQVSQGTSHGTVTVNTDGTFSYTHDGSTNYSDSFTYEVTDGSLTSTGTVLVSVLPPPNSPAAGVAIIGNSEFGSLLTADTAGVTDADGMVGAAFTYQWFVDDVAVPGETSSTYMTTFADVGKEVGLEVSFIDDAGHIELVSDTALVTQSDEVSGTQTYMLTQSYEDFVDGSPGDDILTLVGSGENQDFIDLGGGTDTLYLDNVVNDITVYGVETIVGGTDDDTVYIEGYLSSLNGIIVNSPANQIENVVNDGNIQLVDETTVSSGGDFTNSVYGEVVLSTSHITLDSFSTQNGNVILLGDGYYGSSLTITNGSLTNNGQFLSVSPEFELSEPGFYENEFSGDLVNSSTGFIRISQNLTFSSGSSLDVRQGFIGLSPEVMLRLDSATLMVDSDSPISSDGSAIVRLDGASTLEITGSYNISGVGTTLDFAGTVNVTGGTLSVGRAAGLDLTGDDIDVLLTNAGAISVKSGTTTLDGGFSQTASGRLFIDSTSSSGAADLDVTNGTLTNAGLIGLENSDSSGMSSTLSADILQNTGEGQILIDYSTTGHFVDAQLINYGEVYLFADLDLQGNTGSNHSNFGEIFLISGSTLTILSEGFVNEQTGTIIGGGLIDSDDGVTFTNAGYLEPGGTESAGVLQFAGPGLDLTSTGTVRLDIFSTTSHDEIQVLGTLNVGGNVQLNFVSSDGLINGGTIDSVIEYSTLGTVGALNVGHNLGFGYDVTVVDDSAPETNHYDIVVTPPDYDNSAIIGDDWSNSVTWDGGSTPAATDIVLISTHAVTHNAADTDTVTALFLQNGGSLEISNGTLVIQEQSRVDSSSDLNLNSNGTSTGILQVENELIVEGTMNWDNGVITTTGTGVLNIIGTLYLTPGADTEVDATIENNHEIYIAGGGTIDGSSSILNRGELFVTDTTNFNLPITNKSGGVFSVTPGSLSNITHSQDFINEHGSWYSLETTNFGLNVILSNADFLNAGTLEFLDIVGSGNYLFDLNGNGNQLVNTGDIEVFDDATINVEGATLDSAGGDIAIEYGANLTIDGGLGGGSLVIGEGSALEAFGNSSNGDAGLNFMGDVTISLESDVTLLDKGVVIDTLGGDVTILGDMLRIDTDAQMVMNSNDHVNTSGFHNYGLLSLQGNAIHIEAPFENFGLLEVVGDAGGGVKTIDNAFSNRGSIELTTSPGKNNILEIGAAGATAVLTNDHVITSAQSGGADNPNIIRGTLINDGKIYVDHDLELNETDVPVTHENNNKIDIMAGETLTLGANNTLVNSGQITGEGTLDVSDTGVVFRNEGWISPQASDSWLPGGTLTINGNANTEFTESSVVQIDIEEEGEGSGYYDQVVFTGITPALNGRLKINTIGPPSGSYNIIQSTGLGVIFSMIEGTDLYASHGVVLDVTKGATDLTLTAVTPTVGTAGDDGSGTFVATSGVDIFHGLDGNDEIMDISTGDTVFGGGGNDKITTDLNFKRIVGGDGIDTVQFTDATVDLRQVEGYRLEGIEVISVDGNGAQTVTLDAAAIRSIADESFEFDDSGVAVYGDSSDHLVLIGDYVPGPEEDLFYDIRGTGAERLVELEEVTEAGSTRVFIDDQMLVEVQRTNGAKDYYGSAGDDVISSTINNDSIDGRGGNDYLDGGAGNDIVSGGDGNDEIVYDVADTGVIDGGDGIDTLIDSSPGATIDLTGVTNLRNFEKIDMLDSDSSDTLNIDLAGLGNMIGDNSLDSILPLSPGREKLVITGDSGDVVNLAGTNLNDISDGIIGNGAFTSDFFESDYLGDGQMYIRITDGSSLDLYVHANLVDDNPMG